MGVVSLDIEASLVNSTRRLSGETTRSTILLVSCDVFRRPQGSRYGPATDGDTDGTRVSATRAAIKTRFRVICTQNRPVGTRPDMGDLIALVVPDQLCPRQYLLGVLIGRQPALITGMGAHY